jgi:hypothetical protein
MFLRHLCTPARALFIRRLGYITHFLCDDALAIPYGDLRVPNYITLNADDVHLE